MKPLDIHVVKVGDRYRYGFGRETVACQRLAQRYPSAEAAWEGIIRLHPQHRNGARAVRLVPRSQCRRCS